MTQRRRWVALMMVVTVPAIACNAITGLGDDYTEPGDAARLGDGASSKDGASHDGSSGRRDGGGHDGGAHDGGAHDATVGDTAPSCTVEAGSANAIKGPIAPPWKMLGLNLRGKNDAGVTLDEAIAENCAGTLSVEGGLPGYGTIAWGNAAQAQLGYEIATGRYTEVLASPGYTGVMTFASDATGQFGAHAYTAGIGAPLTRDGAPIVLDWVNATGQALTQIMDELYVALVQTFGAAIGGIPADAGGAPCASNESVCIFADESSGGGYVFFPGLSISINFPPVTDAGGHDASVLAASAPSQIVVYRPTTWAVPKAAPTADVALNKVIQYDGGFNGVESDGRYLYLVPNTPNGSVARYDTLAPLTSADAGWEQFALGPVEAGASAYQSGCVSPNYPPHVYMTPQTGGTIVAHGTASLLDKDWATFDTTTLSPAAQGFAGGVCTFDADYFIAGSVIAQFTEGTTFTDIANWMSYDVTTLVGSGCTYHGGTTTLDGSAYFAPLTGGIALKYSRALGALNDAAAWESFDTSSLSSPWTPSFVGAVSDGLQYIYFVPGETGTEQVVLRYDTTQDFTMAAAWSPYVTDVGFSTGAYDGRYLYLSSDNGPLITYYDSLGATAFGNNENPRWGQFNATTGGSFVGSAFDGRYVYFVPQGFGTVLRLDERFPPTTTSGSSASSW
jgi:hypothetical protein